MAARWATRARRNHGLGDQILIVVRVRDAQHFEARQPER